MDEGAACVHTTCPEAACKTLVPPGLFARLLEGPKLARYRQFRVEHFVSFSKELRWCPAPGCENVVRAGPCVSTVKCAPAGCGFAFCMRERGVFSTLAIGMCDFLSTWGGGHVWV